MRQGCRDKENLLKVDIKKINSETLIKVIENVDIKTKMPNHPKTWFMLFDLENRSKSNVKPKPTSNE